MFYGAGNGIVNIVIRQKLPLSYDFENYGRNGKGIYEV